MPRAKRKTLPGFPKTFKFNERAALDEYLSGDRITCLLCGQSFRILDTHLKAVHGITSDDYRLEYGIPAMRGLACGEWSENQSRLMAERFEDPETLAKFMANVPAGKNKGKKMPFREKPLFWKAEITKNTEADWRDVGALVASGVHLAEACKRLGITSATLLAPAKKRWPHFAKWWDENVEPFRQSGRGHNLTAEGRAKRAGAKTQETATPE